MRTTADIVKVEDIFLSAANQKKIAASLEEAAKYDFKAEHYLRRGNYEKAAHYAILAQEYLSIASKIKREDIHLSTLYN